MNANQAILISAREDQARSRLSLAAFAVLILWALFTGIEALNQVSQLDQALVAILEFIPGLFGIGLLLAAGLTTAGCFLRFAPISKQGLTVFFLMTPLVSPIVLSAVWAGWRPANALVLNPLSAISQELFFRCALLPALLILLPKRPNLVIGLQVLLFGLWHTGPLVTGAPIYAAFVVMLVPALFGLGWGWQTRRDGTVAWAMVYHILVLFIASFYTWG
jgi:hypothetical protein